MPIEGILEVIGFSLQHYYKYINNIAAAVCPNTQLLLSWNHILVIGQSLLFHFCIRLYRHVINIYVSDM